VGRKASTESIITVTVYYSRAHASGDISWVIMHKSPTLSWVSVKAGFVRVGFNFQESDPHGRQKIGITCESPQGHTTWTK